MERQTEMYSKRLNRMAEVREEYKISVKRGDEVELPSGMKGTITAVKRGFLMVRELGDRSRRRWALHPERWRRAREVEP